MLLLKTIAAIILALVVIVATWATVYWYIVRELM